MLLDVALIGATLAGALAGWRRGFVTPLIATAGVVLGLSTLYAGPGSSVVPAGALGIGIGAAVVGIAGGFLLRIGSAIASVVHRISVLRAADNVLGVPLGAATGLVGAYIALAALLSIDIVLAPLHGKASIDDVAVAAVRAAITAQPQFGVIADPAMLDEMAAAIAKNALPREELAKYASTLAFYEDTVRPQLLASALGPLIVGAGQYLPVVGRHLDYPTK